MQQEPGKFGKFLATAIYGPRRPNRPDMEETRRAAQHAWDNPTPEEELLRHVRDIRRVLRSIATGVGLILVLLFIAMVSTCVFVGQRI